MDDRELGDRMASVESAKPDFHPDTLPPRKTDGRMLASTIIICIDLVLCALQILAALGSIATLLFLNKFLEEQGAVFSELYYIISWIGVAIGIIIGISGVLSGIFFLLKKTQALTFAYITLFFVVISIIPGIISTVFMEEMQGQMANQPQNPPEMMYMSIFFAIAGLILRLAYNGAWIWAVIQQRNFFKKNDMI